MKSKSMDITAQSVALFRAEAGDKLSEHFITHKMRRTNRLMGLMFPATLREQIKTYRLGLAEAMKKAIKKKRPKQVIELASGFSTLGIHMTQADKALRYLELDTKAVVKEKNKAMKTLMKKEKMKQSKNHILVPCDVVNGSILKKIEKHLDTKARTVIFSEGFNPYLDEVEHDKLVKNVKEVLEHCKTSVYISQDSLPKGRKKMFSGKGGKLMDLLFRKRTGSAAGRHFKTKAGCISYFKKHGLKAKVLEDDVFILYEARLR